MWLPAVLTGVLRLWVWAVEVRRRRGPRLTAWHRHSKLLLSRWMLYCVGTWCLPAVHRIAASDVILWSATLSESPMALPSWFPYSQAGTAALHALVCSCGAEAATVLSTCPAAVRALVGVATGAVGPSAQYKLAVPLKSYVARLMQHARREACAAVTALALAPMPVPRVLQSYAGQLSAAALQAAPGASSLVTAVTAVMQASVDVEE